MKRIVLAALALTLIPVLGAAQEVPPPGPPPGGPGAMGSPSPERMAGMRRTHDALEQLRTQTRTQLIASLTPQHRAQLATMIGQFAVTPNADPRALSRAVDGLLTRNEAQSVVNLVSSERTNARGVMQAARAQFEATLPADQRSAMDARESRMESMRAQHRSAATDLGRELVRELIGFGGEHGMHGMHGEHGGPGPDMQGGPPHP